MNKNDIELVKSMLITKKELENAIKNFDHASGDLIDYYTYQMKADKAKLDYLIKELKQKGISLSIVEDLKLRIV